MRTIDVVPNTHPVSDFLQWQRAGTLNLRPFFQRRAVWKPGAASLFIDTIVRGLPVPLIFLRERVDLDSQTVHRDVVDGQQRLRTLFSYIDAAVLSDFDPARDEFVVRKSHNEQLAGANFSDLEVEWQRRILSYKLPVITLPTAVEDQEVLRIFARLNSTGQALNYQELRNAEYFGAFKTLMYELAYEQLVRWRSWSIFDGDEIARMKEVELTSDLVHSMHETVRGKSKAALDNLYERYDDEYRQGREVARRFRTVMEAMEDSFGAVIPNSVFNREMHFYSLFLYTYDKLWGLGSALGRRRHRSMPTDRADRVLRLSSRFEQKRVPAKVLDSVARASTDVGRRTVRFDYTRRFLDGNVR